jgi:outer membrane protein
MRYIFLVIFIFRLHALWAQSVSISFEDAITIGLENDVAIKQQKNNLHVFQANKAEGVASYFPTIAAVSNATSINGRQFDNFKGAIVDRTTQRLGVSVGANLSLFNGFQRINSIRRLNVELKSQALTIEKEIQDLVYNIALQFQQIMLDKELLKIRKENLESQFQQFQQIDAFLKNELVPITDFYDQKTAVGKAELSLLEIENILRSDKNILVQLLQLEPGTEIEVVEPDWTVEELLIENFNVDTLYKEALVNRPDYNKLIFDERAADLSLNIASAGYFPNLGLFYELGSSYTSAITSVRNEVTNQDETVTFKDQLFDLNVYRIAGLSLRIPIFDGLRTNTNIIRAKIQRENLNLQTQNLKRSIYTNVQNAYLDFIASKKNYQVAQNGLLAAKTSLELQQERYNLGAGDFVELANARNNYIEAASSLAQAKAQLFFQKYVILYQTGSISYFI